MPDGNEESGDSYALETFVWNGMLLLTQEKNDWRMDSEWEWDQLTEKRPKTKDQTCVVKFRQCRRTWLAVSVGIWQNGRSWGRFLSLEFRLSAVGRLSRIADQRNDFIFWNRRSVAGRFYLVWLCPRSGLVMMTGSFKASEHWKKATWKGKKDEVAPCWQGRWHHGPGSKLGPRRLIFELSCHCYPRKVMKSDRNVSSLRKNQCKEYPVLQKLKPLEHLRQIELQIAGLE